MKIEKLLEIGAGVYLTVIGPEDIALGGSTIIPSALIGGLLIADGFGVKLW